jgi:hypothetical protein
VRTWWGNSALDAFEGRERDAGAEVPGVVLRFGQLRQPWCRWRGKAAHRGWAAVRVLRVCEIDEDCYSSRVFDDVVKSRLEIVENGAVCDGRLLG